MITNITSRANSKITEYAKLKQKKYRDISSKMLIEGERIVRDAISRNVKIEAILCIDYTQDAFEDYADKAKCPMYVLTPSVYELVSSTENSQGIIAVVIVDNITFDMPKGKFLVLDHIQDPGNLGTIIRTAVACNFADIYLVNCVDWKNEKVIRATMGTVFDCRLYVSSEQNISQLAQKYTLIATKMSGESVFEYKPKSNIFGVIMGNEANGISQSMEVFASANISLPMQNNVESLNVAVATAVIMYILNKQGE